MGMFDTVRCEHGLPPAAAGATEFQTKSLACALDSFVLTASGRLLRADGSDTEFHGVMRLHGRSPSGQWVGLEAKFSDGTLQHLAELGAAQYDDFGLRLKPSQTSTLALSLNPFDPSLNPP